MACPPRSTPRPTRRKLLTIDATCPLVKRVHSAVKRHNKNELQIILIGHAGHPEVVGTMGQLDDGQVILVETPEDVWKLEGVNEEGLAYTTQTTLSIEETRDIIQALKKRFPLIKGPEKGDLCYATTNRQQAVTDMAKLVDILIVIGSANSSNSNRLRELGERMGKPSYLIDGPTDMRREWLEGVANVGISSGASAPEDLVQDVVKWIQREFPGHPGRGLRDPGGERAFLPARNPERSLSGASGSRQALPDQKIAFFLSGHGFGHGVRNSAVIEALPADVEVDIYTSLAGIASSATNSTAPSA